MKKRAYFLILLLLAFIICGVYLIFASIGANSVTGSFLFLKTYPTGITQSSFIILWAILACFIIVCIFMHAASWKK